MKEENDEILQILMGLLISQDAAIITAELLLLQRYKKVFELLDVLLKGFYAIHAEKVLNKKIKISDLTSIRETIVTEIAQLYHLDKEAVEQLLKDFYIETYLGSQRVFKKHFSIPTYNPAMLDAAIRNDFGKIKWLASEERNIKRLINEVRNQVVQGLLQGKSYLHTASRLSDRLGIGASRALRIVRTESHRIQNTAKLDAFDKAKKAAEAGGYTLLKKWIHGRGVKDPRDGKKDPDINHVIMNNTYADIETGLFVLPDKTETLSPGNTGKPEHDINCNCDMIFELK